MKRALVYKPRKDYHKPGRKRVYKRGRKQVYKPKPLADKPFRVIDGEATSNGTYFLLSIYDPTCGHHNITNYDGLSTQEMLDFLLEWGPELWAFGAGYDINHWIKDLHPAALERLRRTNRTYWREFKIEHVPGKVFKVWRRVKKIVQQDDGSLKVVWQNVKGAVVWDALNFCNTSFANWTESWNLCESPEALEWLRDMKDRRSFFAIEDAEEIDRYNRLELEILHKGVIRLKELVDRSGYRPRAWYSPGSIASSALTKHGVQEHIGPQQPPAVEAAIEAAYYGGRFEVAAVGFIPGPLYAYDIRSAYPAAAVDLPSLRDSTWEHYEGKAAQRLDWQKEPYALLRIKYTPRDKRQTWGAFPIRTEGFLKFPLSNSIHKDLRHKYGDSHWFWSTEVRAGLPFAKVRVLEAYVLRINNPDKPFAWLADMYDERRRLKAVGDPSEYVFKLIINSVYGKLAQKIHPHMPNPPRFRSLIWAGLITASTRAKLLQAITQGPMVDNPVFMLATDGLFSSAPLELPLGDSLGQWEEQKLSWMMVVQSGVYYYKSLQGLKERQRGLRKERNLRRDGTAVPWHTAVYRHWKHGGPVPISFSRSFVGYRRALALGNLDLWRTWQDDPKRVNMSCSTQRVDLPREGNIMRSRPYLRLTKDILQKDAWDRFVFKDLLMLEGGNRGDLDQPDLD